MIKNLFNVLKKDPYALTGVLIYLFSHLISNFALRNWHESAKLKEF